jgi:hypothetical protein
MNKLLQNGFVITMTFLSAATFVQGQTPGAKIITKSKKMPKTYLDLMVNVVSSNLHYGEVNSDLADHKKSNKGIQAGASLQAGITPMLSLVSELYFMRKGGKLNAGNPLTTGESSLRFNTIELPLLARLHLGRFYMNAGPSIAYTLNGSREIENVSTKLSFAHSTPGFKRFDAGAQVGGGVEFPFKQRRIALDIRYNYGLTNIAYDQEIRNRALMISLHFSKPWKANPLAVNKGL